MRLKHIDLQVSDTRYSTQLFRNVFWHALSASADS
jgi:hypothetical protein